MTHEFVDPKDKKSFRKDMREFHKKQKEREEKELIGTNERPKAVNPAMGIPFNPGGRPAGKPIPKKSEDFQEDVPVEEPKEDLLAGENIKDPEEDDDLEKQRETF